MTNPSGLRSLAFWDLGFESHQGRGCQSIVLFVDKYMFCDEPITRPEEFYRLWCVIVCDLEI